MKNTVLKFDTVELDEFIVSDYFSKKVNAFSIIDQLLPYLETYRMADDDKIERVSYELYGTTVYWDLISTINDVLPLVSTPYNYDIIKNASDSFTSTYVNFIFNPLQSLTDARSTAISDMVLENIIEENEKFRTILVPKKTGLGTVIRILEENGYV